MQTSYQLGSLAGLPAAETAEAKSRLSWSCRGALSWRC